MKSTTEYADDDYLQIEELDGANSDALLKTRVWSPALQGLGSEKYLSETQASTTYYALGDANKNITEYLDASGNIKAHYEFSPFGKTVNATGAMSSAFNYRFSSEYLDVETGLVYYISRYYSPELGRWMSKDPIGERGGKNLYAMVGNRLLNKLDYLGLLSFPSWTVVSKMDQKTAKRMFCLLNKLGYNIGHSSVASLWDAYLEGNIYTGVPLNTFTGNEEDGTLGESSGFSGEIYINEKLLGDDGDLLQGLVSTAMHEGTHIHFPVIGSLQDLFKTCKAVEDEVDGKVDAAKKEVYKTLCCRNKDGTCTTKTIHLWEHYINKCSGKEDTCEK